MTTDTTTSRQRETSAIAGSQLTFTKPDGHGETFDVTDAHGSCVDHLVMIGLRTALSTAVDRAKTWSSIKGGTFGQRAAPKEIDPWRRDLAMVHADEQAKAQGIKPPSPGKKVTDHPDYKMLLENATQQALGLSKERMAEARRHPAVVAHHAGLTGGAKPVSALFGGDPSTAAPGPAPLALAAE